MQTHELKCVPPYFEAVAAGQKNFEVRRDDRGYQKGDLLVLRRYEPGFHPVKEFCFTGEKITRRISYVLTGGQFGIEPGHVVLALEVVAPE